MPTTYQKVLLKPQLICVMGTQVGSSKPPAPTEGYGDNSYCGQCATCVYDIYSANCR